MCIFVLGALFGMEKICENDKCTGCAACCSVCPQECITMRPSDEGFLFPEVDDRLCIDCDACAAVCPQNHPVSRNRPLAVYAGWSRDTLVRTSSSSGGAFRCLAESVMMAGGVVFGAVLCDDMVVRHIAAESIGHIGAMQGSKYAQSEMGNSYALVDMYLDRGKKVLFSGTPCQIAGLRSKYGDEMPAGLFLVDIVCHGVPSVKFFNHYMACLKAKYPDMDERSFQFRTLPGWSAAPNVVIGGERVRLRGRDGVYTKLFLNNLLHRESCYDCPYAATGRVSDITIADFWGIGEEIPFGYDTSCGCSLVMVNTDRGKDLFKTLGETFFSCVRPLDEAVSGNAQLRLPSERPSNRSGIYDFLFSHDIDQIADALFPNKK